MVIKKRVQFMNNTHLFYPSATSGLDNSRNQPSTFKVAKEKDDAHKIARKGNESATRREAIKTLR